MVSRCQVTCCDCILQSFFTGAKALVTMTLKMHLYVKVICT